MNRGVYIADNLNFLKSLNDQCIDLVCIDPPFAKNDTFTGDPIQPALSDAERAIERRLLAGGGVTNAREAEAAGIVWPDGELQGGYRDIWSWEGDVHEEWLTGIEEDYPAIPAMIEGIRLVHSDSLAAYLCYMAIRLLEIHRVLKPTGSLYLHCDRTVSRRRRRRWAGRRPNWLSTTTRCWPSALAIRQLRWQRSLRLERCTNRRPRDARVSSAGRPLTPGLFRDAIEDRSE